jgi:hypothetical protein
MASGNVVVCFVAVGLWLVGGCGGDSTPDEYAGPPTVSGMVTLDSVSLADATVSFENSEGGPFQAITNSSGQYAFEDENSTPPSGKYLVRITRSTSAETAGDGLETAALPARYNTKSELVVDVLSGQNPIDFSLTSSPEDVSAQP